MDAPPGLEVPASRPLLGRGVHAFAELGLSSKLALACVAFGWFFMVTNLGSFQHGVRFFDMTAIIADPSRLFFGVDAPFHRAFFGLICLGCLLAPLAAHLQLAPHPQNKRSRWLGYAVPLALMLICGVVLPGRDMVSRHIVVASGAYLALLGSSVLASQGIRQFCR